MSDQEVRQKWTEYREERERLDIEEEDAPADATESGDDRPADEPDAPGDSQAPEKDGFAELIALFVRAQFSLFDALWFFLAIGSAWRIGSGGFGKSD